MPLPAIDIQNARSSGETPSPLGRNRATPSPRSAPSACSAKHHLHQAARTHPAGPTFERADLARPEHFILHVSVISEPTVEIVVSNGVVLHVPVGADVQLVALRVRRAVPGALEPLYRLMCGRVRLSAALHTDETPVILLARDGQPMPGCTSGMPHRVRLLGRPIPRRPGRALQGLSGIPPR